MCDDCGWQKEIKKIGRMLDEQIHTGNDTLEWVKGMIIEERHIDDFAMSYIVSVRSGRLEYCRHYLLAYPSITAD